MYAGRVGTGFDNRLLRTLHRRLEKLARPDSPFKSLPAAARRGAHFVAPELVCEVAFTEWTGDGHLRHPSFLGPSRGQGRKASDPRTPSRRAGSGHAPAAAPPKPRTPTRKTARAKAPAQSGHAPERRARDPRPAPPASPG